MTDCRKCSASGIDLYLCNLCIEALTNMLDEIPWLLDELDARIQRLDCVSVGTIGRKRRPDELNVMDFGAAETAREIRKKFLRWVTTIAHRHTGRTPPGLDTVTTPNLARWLRANINAVARLDIAGDFYHDIDKLVSTKQDGGSLHRAINRTDRAYYGPCTVNVGRDRDGHPVECGHDLYAPRESTELTCPGCKTQLDPRKQLTATITRRDLVTEEKLLEAMADLGEPLSRVKLYEWIKAGRVHARGYLHQGQVVAKKVRYKDPRVFSLSQIRQLRWQAEAEKACEVAQS